MDRRQLPGIAIDLKAGYIVVSSELVGGVDVTCPPDLPRPTWIRIYRCERRTRNRSADLPLVATYPEYFSGTLIGNISELVARVMFTFSGRLSGGSREYERDGKSKNQAD